MSLDDMKTERSLPFDSSQGALPAHSDNTANTPLISSSFLDESRTLEDDTTSDDSTVSTNSTMSNLPGPGRLLGNLYSRAGRALERRMRKWMNREVEKATKMLQKNSFQLSMMFFAESLRERMKACEILLNCAKSDDVAIQVKAFEEIVCHFIEFSSNSSVHSAFRRVFEEHNESSDVITSSWKRPYIEYTSDWIYWYKLASRCLSRESNFFQNSVQSFGFSGFERRLLSCGDATDLLLAFRFITSDNDSNQNRADAEAFVHNRGVDDPALVNFTFGMVAFWEVHFSWNETRKVYFSEIDSEITDETTEMEPICNAFFRLLIRLIIKRMRSLESLVAGALDELSQNEVQLAVWAEIFKLHHIVRSYGYYSNPKHPGKQYPFVSKPWSALCHKYLPNSEQAELRRKLLHLEDVHGATMFMRFPPQSGSRIDLEKNDEVGTLVHGEDDELLNEEYYRRLQLLYVRCLHSFYGVINLCMYTRKLVSMSGKEKPAHAMAKANSIFFGEKNGPKSVEFSLNFPTHVALQRRSSKEGIQEFTWVPHKSPPPPFSKPRAI
ncbi:hypothetical protein SCHPADRAFT_987560 [Schizopora paradoxa]|uniref:Uncharacterized protein n=1 Tax=Schizopora paradoxa TaxID=27342 RepID=A0A0H2RLS1_9AGAM|nr:hypothetical protein SCHPADRAFT_987560 [Schizopora paradoxa]